MMLPTLTIEFPCPPAVLRGNSRGSTRGAVMGRHQVGKTFRNDRIMQLRQEIIDHEAARFHRGWGAPDFTQGIVIQYTQHYWRKPVDADNILMGLKSVQDALRAIGLPDDSPEWVTVLPVKYVRVQHRDEAKVVMQITEARRVANDSGATGAELS